MGLAPRLLYELPMFGLKLVTGFLIIYFKWFNKKIRNALSGIADVPEPVSRVLFPLLADSCHLSERPTRTRSPEGLAGHLADTYLALQPIRFSHRFIAEPARELLPHGFTLTPVTRGGLFSVALSVSFAGTLFYQKVWCPVLPGLSSP